jgi:lipoprotein-anchoring transpeptidase ErfK/SrfK
MILRSILLLGVGAAFACATPALAAGTSLPANTETAAAQPQAVAALEAETPKAEAPAAKKLVAKAAKKKVAKAKAKKKKTVVAEEAKPEKPRGLFAALFGGDIKDEKTKSKEKAAKAAPAKPIVKVKAKTKPEPVVEPEPVELAISGNTGELRSEKQARPTLFASLFGGATSSDLLPETRALDSVLKQKQAKKQFKVKPAFEPQEVEFSGYSAGTIVIDTHTKFLYLVEDSSTARRYAIAVGREGLLFTGKATVGDKQEWPRWIPTLDMQKREPKHYGQYKDGMDGGPENPLGARAIYLFQGRSDTHIRIHGTNQPQSIGSAASNGCFRMINDHVIDLYNRVKLGTPVVVL